VNPDWSHQLSLGGEKVKDSASGLGDRKGDVHRGCFGWQSIKVTGPYQSKAKW